MDTNFFFPFFCCFNENCCPSIVICVGYFGDSFFRIFERVLIKTLLDKSRLWLNIPKNIGVVKSWYVVTNKLEIDGAIEMHYKYFIFACNRATISMPWYIHQYLWCSEGMFFIAGFWAYSHEIWFCNNPIVFAFLAKTMTFDFVCSVTATMTTTTTTVTQMTMVKWK